MYILFTRWGIYLIWKKILFFSTKGKSGDFNLRNWNNFWTFTFDVLKFKCFLNIWNWHLQFKTYYLNFCTSRKQNMSYLILLLNSGVHDVVTSSYTAFDAFGLVLEWDKMRLEIKWVFTTIAVTLNILQRIK